MPRTTVDRRQGVEGHLAAAAEDLAIAESQDAKRAAYERAADHIIAARMEDPTLSFREVDRRLRRGQRYSQTLVRWRESGSEEPPFGGRRVVDSQTRWAAKKAAKDDPGMYVAAFEQAPPAARKAIAKQISKAPEVRAEARKRDAEAETKRKPSPVKPRVDHTLYEFESRLVSARRDMRDALALVDGIDHPGDDEDILELIAMLKQLVDAVEEAYRSGKSIDTWAWELYERSAD